MSYTSFMSNTFNLVWCGWKVQVLTRIWIYFCLAQHWAEVMIRVQVEEAVREETDFWIWFDHFIDLIRFPNVHVGGGYCSFFIYIYICVYIHIHIYIYIYINCFTPSVKFHNPHKKVTLKMQKERKNTLIYVQTIFIGLCVITLHLISTECLAITNDLTLFYQHLNQ